MSNRLKQTKERAVRRAHRVRSRFTGTAERPRLQVSISNRHITAQVIDDENSKTMVAVSTVGKKLDKKSMTEKATWVGQEVAKKAQAKKIKQVVYDRGARLYHGRMKALADAAREAGLEF